MSTKTPEECPYCHDKNGYLIFVADQDIGFEVETEYECEKCGRRYKVFFIFERSEK